MHQTLYRKWRPADFSSVVGQDHITDVLRYEVQNGKTTHAYLFCGSRGTGKTTCAKILAKAINCLSPVDGNPCGHCEACRLIEDGNATDIIEMDAASNNGVDYIRNIREDVVYTPAFLKKKVYIIDEVHMLSSGAFNALLKTLEEPPEHIVFILATTELQKLPATITSRCQLFSFRRIGTDDIAGRLEYIASQENISVTHEAAKLIGKLSAGGMRDSISLLELCSGFGATVDVALVNETAGVTGRSSLSRIASDVVKKKYDDIFDTIAEFSSAAIDLSVFWQDLIGFYRDMLLVRTSSNAGKYLDLTEEEYRSTESVAALFTREKLLYHIRLLEEGFLSMQKTGAVKRTIAELTLLRMSDERLDDSTASLLSRIAGLEEKLASGASLPSQPVRPVTAETEEPSAPQNAPVSENAPMSDASSDKPPERNDISGSAVSSEPMNDPTALTPIPTWAEIVSAVSAKEKCTGAMLGLTDGYTDAKGLVVKVFDVFSSSMLDTPSAREMLASAANTVGELNGITPDGIRFLTAGKEEKREDPLTSLETP